MNHKPFSKIGQFRNIIRELSGTTVTFTGTVKLHGTNSGVGKEDGKLYVQSRTRLLTPEDDNYGFAAFVEANKTQFEAIVPEGYIVYGEWCGRGIQKGVGISQLPKMFVIFAVRAANSEEGTGWVEYRGPVYPDNDIYCIHGFAPYTLTIDFNRPEIAQAQIIKWVEEVEAECPVAKALGVSGIGEGIVFTGEYQGRTYRFKAKGQKHSVSKVKTVAPVDVEKMNSIHEFVDYAVTENRLKQGLALLVDPSMKQMGDFLRWVCNDIHAEESDVLEAAGLAPKDVNKFMMTKARDWFMENH